MDEQKLENFFKSLKVSLNNASIYFKNHPMFKKCVEDLKNKADLILQSQKPIKIGISPQALWVDNRYWEDSLLYKDLAKFFHRRRIKNIEIKNNVAIDEWFLFLESVCLPLMEILKGGGINNILKVQGALNISVEELDYSQLLKGEGAEYKDIWMYLFEEAAESENFQKINSFIDDFDQILNKFAVQDFLENPQLSGSLQKFLSYLNKADQSGFIRCIKAFSKFILREKNIIGDDEKDRLADFFKNVSSEAFADILWEEISSDEKFTLLTFKLFSQLIDKNRHEDIATSLTDKIKKQDLTAMPAAREKIKELLTFAEGSFTSATYQRSLSSFLRELEMQSGASRAFDRQMLEGNYRLMLLNLLCGQKNPNSIKIILDKINKKYAAIINDKDLSYLINLLAVIEEIKEKEPRLSNLFAETEGRIFVTLENFIFANDDSVSSKTIENIKRPVFAVNIYIDKIFVEGRISPFILQFIFKFFPNRLSCIYRNLHQKSSDLRFLKKFIDAVIKTDSVQSFKILKFIFFTAKGIIKIEAIKAIENLTFYDERFLFRLLKGRNPFLKRYVIAVLIAKGKEDKLFKNLFPAFNPFGLRDGLIEENLGVMGTVLPQKSQEYLSILFERYRAPWHRKLKKIIGGLSRAIKP